jgi:uncharacterized protein YbjT (DUF2867 family)
MKIVVMGGTGLIGSKLVKKLRRRGRPPRRAAGRRHRPAAGQRLLPPVLFQPEAADDVTAVLADIAEKAAWFPGGRSTCGTCAATGSAKWA